MKSLLLVATLTAITLPANAQQLPYNIPAPSGQWITGWNIPYNGDNTPPSRTDFDRFYKIEGNTRKIWTRKINEWLGNDNIKATLNYSTIYCDRNQYQLNYTLNYNSNGVIINTSNRKSPVYNVVPGSNAEILVNTVCR